VSELTAVQEESQRVFEDLLRSQGRAPRVEAALAAATSAPTDATARFSVFDAEQAPAASALALGLAVVAAAAPSTAEGLADALATARRAAEVEDPELVHHALSLFVTHSKDGRRLFKPRSVTAAPRRFAPSSLTLEADAGAEPALPPERIERAAEAGGSTGDERRLDFWREDPLANEHHEHWHEVYPWSGLFPADWLEWAREADREGLAELLAGLDPAQDWPAFLETASAEEVSSAFLSRAGALINRDVNLWLDYLDSLSARAYGTLRHLNDRQGELFFYMHEQMLARYEAERLSHDLPRVVSLDDFAAQIPEGYDPGPAIREFDRYRERRPGQTLVDADAERLQTWRTAIMDAVDDRAFRGTTAPVPITRTNIGDNVEGTDDRLRPEMSAADYPGTHNPGHPFISRLSEVNDEGERIGVMFNPRTAIRDPVFWRWHKYIDDLNFDWQETRDAQTPADFATDAPPVVLRDSLDGGATPWSSPDVILCRTADLPGHEADDFVETGGKLLGAQAFGGAAWTQDFTDHEGSLPDGTAFRTTAELTTEVKRRELVIEPPPEMPGPAHLSTIDYLTHEPFCYFLRVENVSDRNLDVTARIFIAPEDTPDEPRHERRAWIEMDKFIHPVPAKERVVIFRPDVLSAVIKKPADVDPANPTVPQPGGDDGGSYCQCGWPYTLLLPRGTEAGMPFRLLVLLTNAAADQVPQAGGCGSMSFCGAVDRYPDARDMGYPFACPFEQPIADTLLPLNNAAGRRFSIKRS
jgi:Hemocyanin, copper containing domain/Hemocyanin, ig-like domain